MINKKTIFLGFIVVAIIFTAWYLMPPAREDCTNNQNAHQDLDQEKDSNQEKESNQEKDNDQEKDHDQEQ